MPCLPARFRGEVWFDGQRPSNPRSSGVDLHGMYYNFGALPACRIQIDPPPAAATMSRPHPEKHHSTLDSRPAVAHHGVCCAIPSGPGTGSGCGIRRFSGGIQDSQFPAPPVCRRRVLPVVRPVISETRCTGKATTSGAGRGRCGHAGAVLLFAERHRRHRRAVVISCSAEMGRWQVPPNYDLAVQMLRWTFPVSVLSLDGVAFSGVLNSYGHFFLPAFTPGHEPVYDRRAARFFASRMRQPRSGVRDRVSSRRVPAPVPAACGGATGVAELAALAPATRRRAPGCAIDVPNRRLHRWRNPDLRLYTQIATFLVTGSVTWLYYADRLMEFPLAYSAWRLPR